MSMTQRCRLWLVGAISFLTGTVLTIVAAYLVFKPVQDFLSATTFLSAASTGKLYAKTLRMVRAGETDRVVDMLEPLLDSEIMTLAEYEALTPERDRDRRVYDAVAYVREYRHEFPTPSSDPTVRELVENALALSTESGTP
jgi:hypothetical protein